MPLTYSQRQTKVIIAGSRKLPAGTDWRTVHTMIDCMAEGIDISEVVCGCAIGVDDIGRRWAEDHGITVVEFPANWDLHGRSAGPIRNRLMADYADSLIAVWDGESKGTQNMIDTMKKLGKTVKMSLIGARLA
jgi:hypothetical protein